MKNQSADMTPGPAAARTQSRFRYGLSILSGVMLGFSFPPSTFGILACFGLVPLLIALSGVERLRTALKFSYVAMAVFHVITLNWTGGYVHAHDPYMMIAGAITMLLHPAFYFLPMGAYHAVRKNLGNRAALIAFPFLWVGYEYSHSLSEWSFPWLTIGNSQSYDLLRMQFISVTGIYGLSVWVLVLNVIAYLLYLSLVDGRGKSLLRGSLGWLAILLAVYIAPAVQGMFVLSGVPAEPTAEKRLTVGIIQANVDPWEKWRSSGAEATALYVRLTDSLLAEHKGAQIVFWPETALPVYLLAPGNALLLHGLKRAVDSLGVAIVTGMEHAIVYGDSTKAPAGARRTRFGERYDSFNAAAFIQPRLSDVAWYGKMKMVPLAERIPYADAFAYLDFMRWGVGIGGWQIGPDTVVFTERESGVRFSTIICYESVYPGFVASFVRKGAEFIALITIDSWWGRMSGAFQHQQFAVFRAVENRRWIVRCAVGGISCFIDPYGRAYDRTELFTRATLNRTIGLSDTMTFYTAHGDWLGEIMLLVAGLFGAAAVGQKFLHRRGGAP